MQSAVRSVSQAIPGYLAGALLLPPEDYLLGGFARPRLVGELTRLAAEAAVAAICEAWVVMPKFYGRELAQVGIRGVVLSPSREANER